MTIPDEVRRNIEWVFHWIDDDEMLSLSTAGQPPLPQSIRDAMAHVRAWLSAQPAPDSQPDDASEVSYDAALWRVASMALMWLAGEPKCAEFSEEWRQHFGTCLEIVKRGPPAPDSQPQGPFRIPPLDETTVMLHVEDGGQGQPSGVLPADSQPQPYLVEVRPPEGVIDMVELSLELPVDREQLRFVIYNDAEIDAWLQPQPEADAGQWIPVADSGLLPMRCGCGDPTHGASIEVFDDDLLRVWDGDCMAQVFLSDNMRLCQRVAAPQAEAGPMPNWDDAPEWAGYWAMDMDTHECWHQYEPRIDESLCKWVATSDSMWFPANADHCPNWKQTLQRRPQTGETP